jgi:hypothetical protein
MMRGQGLTFLRFTEMSTISSLTPSDVPMGTLIDPSKKSVSGPGFTAATSVFLTQ